jgi:hypothetical protein
MRRLRLFINLNGDAPKRLGRDFEDLRAKLRQIMRGCQRHRLPVAHRRLPAFFIRRSQRICFSSHTRFDRKSHARILRSAWQKMGWIGQKLFFSSWRGWLTIFTDEIPVLIWEIGSFNLHIPGRSFQAVILNTSRL